MSTTSERWAEGPSLLGSVWRYRWLVLATALLMGAAGYVFSQGQDEVYEANTVIYLANPENAGVFGQAGNTDFDRYLPQQAERATSTSVLSSAAQLLGDGTTPGDLEDDVEATADLELGTVEIVATAGTAEDSAAVANAVVTAYQDIVQTAQLERTARATTELDLAAEDLEQRIAEVESEAGVGFDGEIDERTAGQVEVLSRRLSEIDALRQQLEVDARLFGSGVEFVEEAAPPGGPIAPTPRRTAAILGILGALLASALAYWLAGRGQRVASRDEPGRMLGVPLLGVLPTYSPADRGTLRERTALEPRTAEAYRFVHSSLDATLRELDATSVMITSASPSTGKTETALQVAATAQRRGQEVLLIDADLRMRGLTRFLRAERSPGLRDLADRPAGAATSLVARYPLGDQRELSVLAGGLVADDGNEQLNETWFGAAFAELTAGHDLTVVDSPPLLAVSDTAMIAGYTDAIVLVIREGSNLDELERVRQRLQFVGRQLIGYIYLSPSALDDTAFDYGLARQSAWEALVPKRDPGSRAPGPTDDRGQPAGQDEGGAPERSSESISVDGSRAAPQGVPRPAGSSTRGLSTGAEAPREQRTEESGPGSRERHR